ncbi:uncharacterized protein LOC132692941 [Panthera onca]|uniref:uncharacterized protein LOC132692941 n=1 Tax=Panthera onca TaxID=9690 RepID=UPI002952E0E6|nr:uncharacterized protein LOC132692941 [Panthera onca]
MTLLERARGLQQASFGRLIPARSAAVRPCGTPGQAAPALSQRGKSLDPKGWGRTKSLWKTSLLSHCLCDWGSCGREDAVVLFSLPPHPQPSPRCQCARTRPSFYLFFLVFFHPIFSPPPFLSSTCPSFLLYFLRRKASLSVFTADLDLNVHTIKARGECQEWGWLSTVGPRGPAGKEPQSRGALRRAQRRGFGREGSRAPAGWANPEPEPLGRGGVQLVTDMGLERQTDSGREADSVTETDLCKHRCDGGGGGVPVSALRSASVCIFFSGLGAHCMWVDTFRGCVFVLGLAFGSPFKKNNLASRRLAVCARAWTTDILCSP